VVPTKEHILDEQNAELDPINEEFDEIYEIVMPNFSFFSGINYEPWATEMKKLLWLVDLLHYDHEGRINFYDKRRGAITLQLIISTLDEKTLSSILHEFGEVCSAKIFWDILEMKKWSENVEVDEGIVVENGDCVDSLVTGTKTENDIIEVAMINEESMYVAHSKVACHSKEIPYNAVFSDLVNSIEIDDGDECVTVDEPLCESLVNLVKYDDENFSSEGWFQMLQEKKLVDDLLSGRVTLLADQLYEKDETELDQERIDPGGYRWPPTFSSWLKTIFSQFW
jgi:hypothetical protein